MHRSLTIALLLITVVVLSFLPATIEREVSIDSKSDTTSVTGFVATKYALLNGIKVSHIKGTTHNVKHEYVWVVIGNTFIEF